MVKDWPDYEVSNEGRVRKRSNGSLLTEWHGQVRLARNRSCRSWRKVPILMDEVFKDAYVAPEMRNLSEPGEEWKFVEWDHGYMISSMRRVWSWKSLRFVGSPDKNGAIRIQTNTRGSVVLDKIYYSHFGYCPPCLDGEEWRNSFIDGIMVSNKGRVFSKGARKLLTPQKKEGYLTVPNERGRRRFVHRLVAEAFIPRIEGKNYIDHINEDKTDNRVENLRWCTLEENCNYYMANHPPHRGDQFSRPNSLITTPPIFFTKMLNLKDSKLGGNNGREC